MTKPLVTDATDKSQVKRAEQKVEIKRDREMSDLCVVLNTLEGRRVFWRLLEKSKVFESVWENSAKIHYNAGQQDFGHFLMAEIVEADPNLLFQLMRENKQESK